MSEKLSPEEREILDQFEQQALHPVADVEHELEVARQAARNTFNKTRGPKVFGERQMNPKREINAFEHDGHWWAPGNPDQKWTGTFRFDKSEGGTLRLTVPMVLQAPPLLTRPLISDDSIVVGITTKGKLITLIGCFQRASNLNLQGGPCSVEIYANAAIQGFHCDQNPVLDSVSVSLASLNDWWGDSGIKNDPGITLPSITVRYVSRAPLVVQEDDCFRISLKPTCSYSHHQHDFSMHEEIRLEIEAQEPQVFSRFDDLIHAWTDLLSIASMNKCERTETLLFRTRKGESLEYGTHHAVPIYKAREREVQFWLFRMTDIPGDTSQVISTWLSQSERLRYVRALYFEGVHGRGFVEQKFLFLTQAAEALHRLYYQGVYMEDHKKFETEIFRPLTSAIPATVDSRLREAIVSRLKFANECSLRHRLRELVCEHRETLEVLVKDPEQWVGRIVELRNDFTHFPAQTAHEGALPSSERAMRYNWYLRLLLEACLMKAMGFAQRETVACVKNCETYRQISAKFRNAKA